MKNDGGQTEPKATEGAGSAGSAGAEIIRPDGQADATLLRSLSLLFIERQDDIIEELIKMATSLFPISSMIVFTFDEEIGRFVSTSVVGYPQERVVEMKEKITYTPESIKEDESYSRPLSRFSRLYPAELFSDVSDQDLLETLHPENVNEKREDEGAWHPLDRVSFFFIDRFGKEIGYLYITSTSDNRMLSAEAVAGLDIIASMASVAIELASVRHTEQSQLETQERRAAQISQILAVATSILSITNPSNLIEKVLTSIYDLFGLKSNTLTLYDDAEGCYKWVGFSGYTEAQMARARKLKTPREIIERDTRPEYRIGYLAHFKPAEKAIPDDFSQYFIFNEEADKESVELHWHKPGSQPDDPKSAERTGKKASLVFDKEGTITLSNKNESTIVMDAKDKKITITDKDNSNKIVMDDKAITITGDKKVVVACDLIHLGKDGPSDHLALAKLTKAEIKAVRDTLKALVSKFNAHKHSVKGIKTAGPPAAHSQTAPVDSAAPDNAPADSPAAVADIKSVVVLSE